MRTSPHCAGGEDPDGGDTATGLASASALRPTGSMNSSRSIVPRAALTLAIALSCDHPSPLRTWTVIDGSVILVYATQHRVEAR